MGIAFDNFMFIVPYIVLSYIVIFLYHVYTVTYIIIEMNKGLKVVFRMVTSNG